jgi:hypothetical protein
MMPGLASYLMLVLSSCDFSVESCDFDVSFLIMSVSLLIDVGIGILITLVSSPPWFWMLTALSTARVYQAPPLLLSKPVPSRL